MPPLPMPCPQHEPYRGERDDVMMMVMMMAKIAAQVVNNIVHGNEDQSLPA